MQKNAFFIVSMVAILLLGTIAYFNTLDGDWVWDDVSSVLLHRHVQDPGQFTQLFKEDQHAFGRGQGNFYRPLVAASFMLDFWLSHDPVRDSNPDLPYPDVSTLLFHISNLLWHLAAAVLLCLLLHRFGAPRFVSFTVPLIFVVHPLHTEAVAYISGRADMMSGVFIFLGLYFGLWEGSQRKRIAGIILSSLAFILGLLSKESTLIFPLLLGLCIFLLPIARNGESEGPVSRKALLKQRALPLAPALIIVLIYGYLRSTVLHFADTTTAMEAAPFLTRLVEVVQAFALYIRLLFIPTGLHMERSLDHVGLITALIGLVVLAMLIGLLVWAVRGGHNRIAIGLGWFFLAWLPISGLFPLNAPMAEHWMYVPMAGFWWAMAELLYAHLPHSYTWRRGKAVLVGALCLLFILLTVQRNEDWKSNERLFRATLAQNPNTIRVHHNLAVTYEDLEGNFSGARRHWEHILALYREDKVANNLTPDYLLPEEIEVYHSLGKIHFQQQNHAEARDTLAFLLNAALQPERREMLGRFRGEIASAAMLYGKAALAMGDVGEAEMSFRQAQNLAPELESEVETILLGAPL